MSQPGEEVGAAEAISKVAVVVVVVDLTVGAEVGEVGRLAQQMA
jgi:hypothetical protein